MKKQRWILLAIGILFIAALIIDLPKIPVDVHIGSLHIQRVLEHPTIDLAVAGTNITKSFDPSLGLDLQGGSQLVLKADMSKISPSNRDQALESARDVIEKRVNLYGVSEPNIYTQIVGNEYRIVVQLAGVKDINQAKNLIGKTAKLEFLSPLPSALTSPYPTIQDFNPNTNLTGADLSGATVVYQNNSATPSIQLNFKPEGLTKFSDMAKADVNKPIAIVLDGQILSDPIVQSSLAQGTVSDPVITGSFTVDAAKELVTQLDAGALPVPVNIIEEQTVGATLGAQSVKVSIIAGCVGILMVLAFMLFIYKRLGLVADFALLLYALLVFAIFVTIPVTLTLAGLAGFILSIGMAVDANILIFERTKEELRKGKSMNIALKLGFARAWTSIRDSNVSTLITTVILYIFGTSIIQGFAITLAIGVIVSMFTAVFITQNILDIFFTRTRNAQKVVNLHIR